VAKNQIQTQLQASLQQNHEASGSFKLVVGTNEIYLDDVVKQVLQQLQTLPKEQYQALQTQMCTDLVKQAEAKTCTMPSPQP
jgi:hypothetical protein